MKTRLRITIEGQGGAAFERMKQRKTSPLSVNTIKQYEIAARKLKHLLRQFTRPDQVKQRDAAMKEPK